MEPWEGDNFSVALGWGSKVDGSIRKELEASKAQKPSLGSWGDRTGIMED